jgi:EVE domain
MTAWIFQCNPDSYDLPGALRESSVETWLANQNRSEIKPGDTVYLWETGKQSGILAVATVLSDPAMMPQSSKDAKYNMGGRDLTGDRWRVRLQVDKLLTPRLLKTDLIKNLALANLPNVKFANATNFKLSPEEATALAEMVAAGGPEPEDEEAQPPPLTEEDFEVLARHQEPLPWNELAPDDKALISALRAKLLDYATALAARLRLRTRLIPFTSHQNPNGRNSPYYWCCVFPEKARNKSYGFQLFLIVHPTHVEVGFSTGLGQAAAKVTNKICSGCLKKPSSDFSHLKEANALIQFSTRLLRKGFVQPVAIFI